MTYRCSVCEELHDDLPDICFDKPDPWWGIPAGERDARIELTPDTCIIDEEEYFIRGVLEIPILDYPESFGFGVWVSQKRENFYTYLKHPDSASIGPFFGWLCTEMSFYEPSTWLLKTEAHFPGGSERPRIRMEPTDHPLAIDQRQGITLAKAWEIVHYYLDPPH